MIERIICSVVCISLIICSALIFDDSSADKGIFAAAKISDELTVIIDAGHGGFDGGCSGIDGTLEKDINLEIAKKLDSMLTAVGFNTVMVRNSDTAVNTDGSTIREKKISDIKFRHSLMKKYQNSIYLCIHQNQYQSQSVNGTQIFYRPNDDMSRQLAECLQNSMANGLKQSRKRPIKSCTKDVYLIYNATTTAVLIECGFLSNQNELQRLKSDDYQRLLCFSIASGLFDMLSYT